MGSWCMLSAWFSFYGRLNLCPCSIWGSCLRLCSALGPSSTSMLASEKNEWQKVESWGDVPEARVGHSAACTNRDSFIVFGGGTLDTNENILYECYGV